MIFRHLFKKKNKKEIPSKLEEIDDYEDLFISDHKSALESIDVMQAADCSSCENEYYLTGLKFFNSGEYTQALEYFQEAIHSYPNNKNSYQMLAETYQMMGKISKAKDTLQQLSEIESQLKTIPKQEKFFEQNTSTNPNPVGSSERQNIDKNTITLSGHVQSRKTLTEQSIGTAEAIKNLPSKSSILDAAFKNVLALLNGVDGGYVTFETDGSDHITEIRIANNMDFEQATNCWRWNLGGLAHLSRTYPSDPWVVNVAMDMTGQMTANFIKTGELIANNGVYELDMSTGYVKMQQGEFTGKITSSSGTIGGFTIGATELKRSDALVSQNVIGCGSAGSGIVNMVGAAGSGDERFGYIQISNSGDPTTCLDGIRIYGNGHIVRYNGSGGRSWDKWLSNIPNS